MHYDRMRTLRIISIIGGSLAIILAAHAVFAQDRAGGSAVPSTAIEGR